MSHFGKLLVTTVGVAGLLLASASTGLAHHSPTLTEFDSMTPVTGAAVGAVNDRGIVGGGRAWVIASGSGEVDRDGSVQVQVHGLVIPSLGNVNPVATMGATVSCLTPTGPVVNVRTAQFPATRAGDVTIQGTVSLPHPCKSPIVFVVGPGGQWFAMSNAEEEDD